MACKQKNCKCGKVKSESIKENKKCMCGCRNGSCQGKCLTKFKLLKKDK